MSSISRRDFLQSTALAVGAGALVAATGAHAREATTASATGQAGDTTGKSPWKKGIKTSILAKVAGKEASWEQKFNLAKESGFDGVEWDDISNPDEAVKIQELARKIGVPFHGVVFGGWHAPLSDPDPAVTEKGLEGMHNAITCAKAMEVKTCLLVPAVVKAEVPYDEAYKRSQDNVRKLVEHAAEAQIIIGLENVWNKFLLSPMEFARYIDEIDSPWVKMYFDTANSLVQGFSEHWMQILGKRIIKVDVKDFSRKEHKFVPVGDGDANFKEITRILKEWNYSDFLTSESNVSTPEELADSARRLDKVFGKA